MYCYANALKDHTIPYYSAALAADNPYSSVKPRDISTIPGFPVIAKVEKICRDKDLSTFEDKEPTSAGQSEHLNLSHEYIRLVKSETHFEGVP